MPSPVGHGLAGLTVHVLAARGRRELHDPSRAGAIVGAALAPDLDLLLRLVDGRNHHQAQMHSVGFAALVALLALATSALLRRPEGRRLAVAVGLGWLSHLALDYFSVDTTPPIGLMALWPFSEAYFKSPWPLFLDIWRTLEWATVRHDAAAAAWESFVLLPLLLAAGWVRSRSRTSGPL